MSNTMNDASACPTIEDLAEAALGEAADGALREHLGACAACRERVARLDAALDLPRTVEPAPQVLSALMDRLAREVVGSVVAAEAPDGPAKLQIILTCCFCHDAVKRPDAVFCAACVAAHHRDCFRRHGRCSAPGCRETSVVTPGAPGRRQVRRRPGRVIAVALAGAAAALVAVAALRPDVRSTPELDMRPPVMDVFSPRPPMTPTGTPAPVRVDWGVDPQGTGRWPYRAQRIERAAWKTSVGEHAGMPMPGADGRIYVLGGAGALHVLEATTGAVLWTGPGTPHVNYATGALGADAVFGCAIGGMRCIDLQGRERWYTDLGASWLHDPPILTPDARALLMNGDAIALTALDAATGKVLWTNGPKGARLSLCFSRANELIVCERGRGISALEPSGGTVLWSVPLAGDWQGCAAVADGLLVAWEPGRVVGLVSRGREAPRVAWQWVPRENVPNVTIGGLTATGERELAVALTSGELAYLTLGAETVAVRKRIVVSDRALSWPTSTPDGEVVVVDVEGDVFVCGAERAWAVQLDGPPGAFPRPAVGPDGRVYVGGRDAVYCLTGGPPPGPPIRSKSLTLMADDFVVDVWVNGQRVPDASRRMHNEVFGAMGERIDVVLRAGDWIVFNVVNNRLRWGGCAYFAVDFADEQGKPVFWTEDDGTWSACDDVSQVEQFIRERDAGTSVRARAPANPWSDGTAYLERELGRKFPGKPVWGASRNTWIKHVVR